MPFFNASSPVQGGLPPEALQLIALARAQGAPEEEIAQMLESSGYNPDEYEQDLVSPLTPGFRYSPSVPEVANYLWPGDSSYDGLPDEDANPYDEQGEYDPMSLPRPRMGASSAAFPEPPAMTVEDTFQPDPMQPVDAAMNVQPDAAPQIGIEPTATDAQQQEQPATEPPGFGQRLLGLLSSGPMAEALMATGFGMLGAQNTYGNLGAAIGQGGLRGVEAFGYATRRAQKEREAAERTRMAEQRLLAQEDARKASRGNVLLQTAMTVVDRGGPDALAAFVKANPELRDLLGGDGFDPSLFRSKNGWKASVSGDNLVLYNDSGEVQVKKIPVGDPDTHEVTVGGPEGDQVVAVDKQGNVRRTIGPAPSTRGGQSKFLEARDPDSPDSGAMVYVQPDPRTGELRPVLGPDGQKVYSRGSGNRPFVRDDNGNVVSASRSGADIPAARKSQLYEAQDRYRLVAPQVRLLIGERDADGNYNGGILTDDVIGAAKAVAQKGKGWEAQVPALRRTIAKLDLKRPTMPAGGSSTPDTEKFTRAAWFKDVSQADYLLNALAFHLALASNPDGRISDQDIKIARARLGGDDWLSSGADVRTRVGNFADEAARGAVNSYIAFGQEERLPENLRGAYFQLNPGDLEPEARTKREGLKQKWGVPKDAPREAPAPDAGGTVVAVGPGGVRKTVPAARAAAGLPSGWSVEGR